jgi:hypothetical protein
LDERGGRGRDYDIRDDRDFDSGGRDFDRGTFGRDYDYGGRAFGRRGRYCDDGRRELHRPPKIQFPSFDGESDPLTWLNKCDNYFRGHRVSEDEKVWMASLHLDGTATEWY